MDFNEAERQLLATLRGAELDAGSTDRVTPTDRPIHDGRVSGDTRKSIDLEEILIVRV